MVRLALRNDRAAGGARVGPGNRDDALSWAVQERPEPDVVDHLDRVFLFQVVEGDVGLPRRPDVVAGLPIAAAEGSWYAVRADSAGEAQAHARAAGGWRCDLWCGRSMQEVRRGIPGARHPGRTD